ncbi:MAG TPA: FAD-dependent oxidoreductase [Pyrinomonadaceae bacterium]|jgi:sarcosine oxidase subunit beta
MQSAGVVIIGAGVIGASVAYHLAARGCRDVLVIERGAQPGEGSTGRATGGFRAQFGTSVNVRLSLLSRQKLLNFREELGRDTGYRPCGYLFLASGQAELDALYAAQEVQRACGLNETRRVSRDEIQDFNPAVRADALSGGVFCPTDGFIRPLEILHGYVESARRLGVRFEYDVAVTGFRMAGSSRIAALRTPRGEIETGCVVNAAGPWAAGVAACAGVHLPVLPLRRQAAATHPCNLLPEDMPMTIFTEDGFHLRVRDGRVLLLWPDQPHVTDPFETQVTDEWLDGIARRAQASIPALSQARIDRRSCWAGLYEMSPDRHALLGPATGVENLYLANGSSGHGVMHAPALGHLLAEIILDGAATTLDVHQLRPSRFIEGEPNAATEFL